jgi:hypothetical protein
MCGLGAAQDRWCHHPSAKHAKDPKQTFYETVVNQRLRNSYQ